MQKICAPEFKQDNPDNCTQLRKSINNDIAKKQNYPDTEASKTSGTQIIPTNPFCIDEAQRVAFSLTMNLDIFADREFFFNFLKDMVRARVLEEQLIQLWRKGQGFFLDRRSWRGMPQHCHFTSPQSGRGLRIRLLSPPLSKCGGRIGTWSPYDFFCEANEMFSNGPFYGRKKFRLSLGDQKMEHHSHFEPRHNWVPLAPRELLVLKRGHKKNLSVWPSSAKPAVLLQTLPALWCGVLAPLKLTSSFDCHK